MGLAVPQYTAIAEGLAGRGYLVAGVTPTYSANLTVLHGGAVKSSPTGNPRAFDNADLARRRRAGRRRPPGAGMGG
jgi:hypothetical protein